MVVDTAVPWARTLTFVPVAPNEIRVQVQLFFSESSVNLSYRSILPRTVYVPAGTPVISSHW